MLVKDHNELAIQAAASVVSATAELRFQNKPNKTIQKTGTSQENNQPIAARIGGSAAATAIAIHAITIIKIRITRVSSFSDAFGR